MKQRTVLITGANSGFGLAAADEFARQGYRVFAGARSKASEALLKMAAERPHIRIVSLDVSRDRSVKDAMHQILSETDSVNVLVNNAGFGFIGPIEDFTIDEIKEQFETNFFGQIRMIKIVAPMMRKNRQGTIINISSINGLVSFPLYGVYSASKFALETLSEALAFELFSFGIRVVLVEPGTFGTGFTANRKHPAHMASKSSPYHPVTSRFFTQLEHLKDARIIRRQDPAVVARLLYQIAETAHPRLRYKVGPDAYFLHWLDRTTPKPLKFLFMRYAYGWPARL